MQARYSRWDDTQDPFGPELSAGELLEELSDDALSGLGIEGALSRLLRRGMRGSFDGLDALREAGVPVWSDEDVAGGPDPGKR